MDLTRALGAVALARLERTSLPCPATRVLIRRPTTRVTHVAAIRRRGVDVSAPMQYRASAYRWRFAAGFCAIAAFTVTIAYYVPARREVTRLRAERATLSASQAADRAALERARRELEASRAEAERLRQSASSAEDATSAVTQRIVKLERLLSAQFGRLEQARMLVLSSAGDRVSVALAVPALFPNSAARVSADGKVLLCELVKTIVDEFKGQIRVTGYYGKSEIDDPRLAARYAGPWQLSAARAASAAEVLERDCHSPLERFMVVAYGPRSAGPLGENVALEFIFRPED
jgi:flagellar motor protein MotB